MIASTTLLTLLTMLASTTASSTAGPCDAAEARQFDFYLGDWDIEQGLRAADGGWITLPAETSVTRAAGGCALVEQWRGDVQFFWVGMTEPAPLHGLSVRAWNPESGAWNIYWLDSQTPVFGGTFSGHFDEAGVGRFYHERETDNGMRISRITFENVTDDSLDWELALSSDDGETWRPLWTMRMTRKR